MYTFCNLGNDQTLISFDILLFGYFCLMLLSSYPVYYATTVYLCWENSGKLPSNHYEDILQSIAYGFILFTLGNYSNTFSVITVIAYMLGLWIFGALVELPFLKHSLATVRSWALGTWVVMLLGLALILAAAGYHLFLAQLHEVLWPWYIGSLVLAVAIPMLGMLLAVISNRYLRRKRMRLLRERIGRQGTINIMKRPYGENEPHDGRPLNVIPETSTSRPLSSSLAGGERAEPAGAAERESTDQLVMATPVMPSNESSNDAPPSAVAVVAGSGAVEEDFTNILFSYQIHLHHWQLFFLLAFFTRFPEPVSQVCAGLVMGCYMHGVIAYGYHPMLEPCFYQQQR